MLVRRFKKFFRKENLEKRESCNKGREKKKLKKITATGLKSFQESHESYLGATFGEDGENENLALMAKSDIDSDNNSTEQMSVEKIEMSKIFSNLKSDYKVLKRKKIESENANKTLKVEISKLEETVFVQKTENKPRQELKNSGRTIPETVDLWEHTSHHREYNQGESETSPSSPQIEVDLPSLIADLRGRYVVQDLVPLPFSPNQSSWSPSGSDSIPTTEDLTSIVDSMSESESVDDLVPLAALKKGDLKRLRSANLHTSTSKVPCVSGPTSRT
ncbi:hypothetical protein HAX54_005741 [Datura stramonium]|uniref:Uncharacterized protein n=1 Tax=Datura stramonium TaxID=4076 RepID=A0ABS8WWK7_DATST|nr:hypothetical protein [Datura stramonium]